MRLLALSCWCIQAHRQIGNLAVARFPLSFSRLLSTGHHPGPTLPFYHRPDRRRFVPKMINKLSYTVGVPAENLDQYCPGGYHPISINDVLNDG